MKKRPCSAASRQTSRSDRRPIMRGDCTVSREQLPIERLDIVDEALEAEARDDRSASVRAHRAAPPGITKKDEDVIRKRGGVAGWREQTDRRGVDHIVHAADIGADAWHT